MVNRSGLLPGRIPPPTTPLVEQSPAGEYICNTNWYLFLYGIAGLTVSNTPGEVAFPPSLNIPIVDIDAGDSDIAQSYRQIANAALQLPDSDVALSPQSIANVALQLPEQDVSSPRDVANALQVALDDLLPDPAARAQPSSAVTLTGSPFTFTALFNGALAISAGTVSIVSIVRQGVTVATGVTAGVIPVSRSDQVVITYTGAPTVVFLPT